MRDPVCTRARVVCTYAGAVCTRAGVVCTNWDRFCTGCSRIYTECDRFYTGSDRAYTEVSRACLANRLGVVKRFLSATLKAGVGGFQRFGQRLRRACRSELLCPRRRLTFDLKPAGRAKAETYFVALAEGHVL